MTSPDVSEEPLKNIELESAIHGLKMALTSEEQVENRLRFLTRLRSSTLVVPTVNAVATLPDGSIAPNTNITFVVVSTPDGVNGVPGFTTVGGLRAALPNTTNGIFLNGLQLASILTNTPHKLFVDGPDLHAEVENEELAVIAQEAERSIQVRQAAIDRNDILEAALAELKLNDTEATRETVADAFVKGFCRIPVAGEHDKVAKCIILRADNPETGVETQEVSLVTEDDSLLCFTCEQAMKTWRDVERNAVALPGTMISELIGHSGLGSITVNRGSNNSCSLRLDQNRLVVV